MAATPESRLPAGSDADGVLRPALPPAAASRASGWVRRPPRPKPLPELPAAAAGTDAASRAPPAAADAPVRDEWSRRRARRSLYALTLLSAVDGTLLALAAAGRLESLGGAIAVGLTVIAGAGSWLAAQQAIGGAPTARDLRSLALLGLLTAAATVAAVALGTTVAGAVQLHVVPKAAGVVLLLVAAEVGGLRLPAPRGVPAPLAALAAGGVLEVLAQWTA